MDYPPPPPPQAPNQHGFLDSNFFNLAFHKKMEKKSANSKKNVNNKTNYQKFEIKNLKEKRLLIMNKSLNVILVIPKLNI